MFFGDSEEDQLAMEGFMQVDIAVGLAAPVGVVLGVEASGWRCRG